MKKLCTLLALLLLLGGTSVGEIRFLKGSLGEAMTRAQAEKKPVMIDFITDWCMWCDTLDTYTYSDAAVADYVNGNIVPIKIDAEKGEGIAIAKKYGVRAYPTILLISATGEEIDRVVGYVPPVPFLNTMRDYVNGVNTIASLKISLEKNPGDPALRYAAAKKFASRNEIAAAAEHYQKLIELDPNNTLGHNDEAEYTLAINAMRAEKNPAKVAAFAEKYPNSPLRRNALGTLVNTFSNAGDADGARKYYTLYAAQWPDDAMMMNNYAWTCAGKMINLDQAAEVSEKAVALAKTDNERAMYLDTQATVEFKRGNAQRAIQLEEQALSNLKNATPKERKEYEDTLEKFKAGKK